MEDRLKQLKEDKQELQSGIENLVFDFHKKYPDVRFEINNSFTWYHSPMNSLYQITKFKTTLNIEI